MQVSPYIRIQRDCLVACIATVLHYYGFDPDYLLGRFWSFRYRRPSEVNAIHSENDMLFPTASGDYIANVQRADGLLPTPVETLLAEVEKAVSMDVEVGCALDANLARAIISEQLAQSNFVIARLDMYYLPYAISYHRVHNIHFLLLSEEDRSQDKVYVVDGALPFAGWLDWSRILEGMSSYEWEYRIIRSLGDNYLPAVQTVNDTVRNFLTMHTCSDPAYGIQGMYRAAQDIATWNNLPHNLVIDLAGQIQLIANERHWNRRFLMKYLPQEAKSESERLVRSLEEVSQGWLAARAILLRELVKNDKVEIITRLTRQIRKLAALEDEALSLINTCFQGV